MGKPGNVGIRRLLRATVYTVQDFFHAFRNEAAFRQELALIVVVVRGAVVYDRFYT